MHLLINHFYSLKFLNLKKCMLTAKKKKREKHESSLSRVSISWWHVMDTCIGLSPAQRMMTYSLYTTTTPKWRRRPCAAVLCSMCRQTRTCRRGTDIWIPWTPVRAPFARNLKKSTETLNNFSKFDAPVVLGGRWRPSLSLFNNLVPMQGITLLAHWKHNFNIKHWSLHIKTPVARLTKLSQRYARRIYHGDVSPQYMLP